MASTSPTPTLSLPLPSFSSPGTQNPNSNNSQASSSGVSGSLYLFTFLATLFLLLLISCAIVLRSFILRRRFRRRVDEALAAGVFLAPSPGNRRHAIGEKPKFYDIWLAPGDGEEWESIMPVSGNTLLSEKPFKGKSPQDSAPSSVQDHEPTSPTQTTIRSSHISRSLRHPFARRRRSPPSPPPPASPEAPIEAVNEEEKLQVSVLVSMPSARRKLPVAKEKDDDVPDVVIGVAEVPYRFQEH